MYIFLDMHMLKCVGVLTIHLKWTSYQAYTSSELCLIHFKLNFFCVCSFWLSEAKETNFQNACSVDEFDSRDQPSSTGEAK